MPICSRIARQVAAFDRAAQREVAEEAQGIAGVLSPPVACGQAAEVGQHRRPIRRSNGRRPGPRRSWRGRPPSGPTASSDRRASRRRWAGRTAPGPGGRSTRRARACSAAGRIARGSAPCRSRRRPAPRPARAGSARRRTAPSGGSSRRPGRRAGRRLAIARPAPRRRIRQRRSRRGTSGTAATPAVAPWPAAGAAGPRPCRRRSRSVFPRMVLGVSSCQSGRTAYRPWTTVRPVSARATSFTSRSENWPTPSVKSSISSRARFSFGLPFRFDGASSQKSRAGSRSIAPQQVAERSAAVAAKRLVLPTHGRRRLRP